MMHTHHNGTVLDILPVDVFIKIGVQGVEGVQGVQDECLIPKGATTNTIVLYSLSDEGA